MVALLTPDLLFADANEEFLRQSGRTREQVVGRYLFDIFPENPNDPGASGMRNLAASLTRVVATGERDAMALQRYDVENSDRPGEWEERYWSPVNAPVFGPDGEVVLLVHRVEEVTELIRARGGPSGGLADSSPAIARRTPRASRTPSCRNCCLPAAPPTTRRWSSCGCDPWPDRGVMDGPAPRPRPRTPAEPRRGGRGRRGSVVRRTTPPPGPGSPGSPPAPRRPPPARPAQ